MWANLIFLSCVNDYTIEPMVIFTAWEKLKSVCNARKAGLGENLSSEKFLAATVSRIHPIIHGFSHSVIITVNVTNRDKLIIACMQLHLYICMMEVCQLTGFQVKSGGAVPHHSMNPTFSLIWLSLIS